MAVKTDQKRSGIYCHIVFLSKKKQTPQQTECV